MKAADVRAAIARLRDVSWRAPELIVHPAVNDQACDLLGVPHGTHLTTADLWKAAEVEMDALSLEEKAKAMDAIFALWERQGGSGG